MPKIKLDGWATEGQDEHGSLVYTLVWRVGDEAGFWHFPTEKERAAERARVYDALEGRVTWGKLLGAASRPPDSLATGDAIDEILYGGRN